MRKATIGLIISAVMLVGGFSLCMPGICGCAMASKFDSTGRIEYTLILMMTVGLFGFPVCLVWLGIAAIVQKRRQSGAARV